MQFQAEMLVFAKLWEGKGKPPSFLLSLAPSTVPGTDTEGVGLHKPGAQRQKATVPSHSFHGILVPVTTWILPAKDPQEAEQSSSSLWLAVSLHHGSFWIEWAYVDQIKHKCSSRASFPGTEYNSQHLLPTSPSFEAVGTTPFGSLGRTGQLRASHKH